jgi:hypothetical protein
MEPAMNDAAIAQAVGQLRETLVELKKSKTWEQIVVPRDSVFARFQPIFQPAYIPGLTEEEFRPFFYYENNHHWTGLFRHVNRICNDMPRLREVLLILTDESRPIEERLDEVGGAILGMGKAIITAILTVAFPAKYGVWNNVSESGLTKLGIFPEFDRGASFGARYGQINAILRKLADSLDIDLWTLDSLWWQFAHGSEPPVADLTIDGSVNAPQPAACAQFGLERHLQEFLYDNWTHTKLGRDWKLFALPGEPDAGYEYTCAVGRIDILAQHRTEKKWLVVELKRNETSDSTVGQVLRYIGWVRRHLAEPGDEVQGLVIAGSVDQSLLYAIAAAPAVRVMTYQVDFRLNDAPSLENFSSR